jgi:hypothetical protein
MPLGSYGLPETDVSETAQEAAFQKQHRKQQAEHRAAPKIHEKQITSSWIRVRI